MGSGTDTLARPLHFQTADLSAREVRRANPLICVGRSFFAGETLPEVYEPVWDKHVPEGVRKVGEPWRKILTPSGWAERFDENTNETVGAGMII